jgi:hypothetical protein
MCGSSRFRGGFVRPTRRTAPVRPRPWAGLLAHAITTLRDIVADDHLHPAQRAERGGYVACIAGTLSIGEYQEGLVTAGFTDVTITSTQQVADGIHSAIIRANKPAK